MGYLKRAWAWFEQATWPQIILAGILSGCALSGLVVIVQSL